MDRPLHSRQSSAPFGDDSVTCEVGIQRLLALLFKSVSVAMVSERLDDVVHGEVCEVFLTKQCLDDLLRLSKVSSLVEAWPKARFRLVLQRFSC